MLHESANEVCQSTGRTPKGCLGSGSCVGWLVVMISSRLLILQQDSHNEDGV